MMPISMSNWKFQNRHVKPNLESSEHNLARNCARASGQNKVWLMLYWVSVANGSLLDPSFVPSTVNRELLMWYSSAISR